MNSLTMPSARWVRSSGLAAMLVLAACGDNSVTDPDPILPTPGVTLTVPTALGVIQGGTTILTIDLARTAYVGAVFMTLTGLPAGVTGPTVTSTSTDRIQVALAASTTATTGQATVTVNISGIDIPSVKGTFVLNVAPR